MKILGKGNIFRIIDDFTITNDKLEPGTYNILFSDQSGYCLEKRDDLDVREEKIYGNILEKVNKVFRGYINADKNFGVILSGDKGIGKTLCARSICKEAIDNFLLPVLLVKEDTPNLADFISSITQDCIVLFDEFEKVFRKESKNENKNPQDKLLSLFDGIDNGHKLFIVTCNDVYKISEFMVNRPGRFHYHFRFTYPSMREIEEYMNDNIKDEYKDQIFDICDFSSMISLNYDCLRSIVTEVNAGYPFKEAIKDLNIINISDFKYEFAIELGDGQICRSNVIHLDIFERFRPLSNITIYSVDGGYLMTMYWDSIKLSRNFSDDSLIIPTENIKYIEIAAKLYKNKNIIVANSPERVSKNIVPLADYVNEDEDGEVKMEDCKFINIKSIKIYPVKNITHRFAF